MRALLAFVAILVGIVLGGIEIEYVMSLVRMAS